jgi:hypothetical protein
VTGYIPPILTAVWSTEGAAHWLSGKHGAAALGDNLEDAVAIVMSDPSGEIPRR